jgi:hypothetical protein
MVQHKRKTKETWYNTSVINSTRFWNILLWVHSKTKDWKPKGPKQDSQNQLRSSMPEETEP